MRRVTVETTTNNANQISSQHSISQSLVVASLSHENGMCAKQSKALNNTQCACRQNAHLQLGNLLSLSRSVCVSYLIAFLFFFSVNFTITLLSLAVLSRREKNSRADTHAFSLSLPYACSVSFSSVGIQANVFHDRFIIKCMAQLVWTGRNLYRNSWARNTHRATLVAIFIISFNIVFSWIR